MPLSTWRLILPMVAATALCAAEPALTVREVRVEGNIQWATDRITARLDVRAGKTYSMGQLQQATADDMKAIEKMGPFFDNRVEIEPTDQPDQFVVVYRVKEQPTVKSVHWRGVGYFTREKVDKLLQTRAGGNLNPLLLENDRRAVLAKFQDDGRRYAKVDVETRTVDGLVEVTFIVDLAAEIEVSQVNWLGLPDAARPKRVQNGLINLPGQPYLPDQVALDEWAAVRNLQDLAWLDARLVKTEREIFDYVRPTESRRRHGPDIVPDGAYNDRVALTYTVDAGARYRLGSVSFVGNTKATSEALRTAFGMAEGDWFTREALYGDGRPGGDVGAIERSRRVISNQGYARCELRTDRVVHPDTHVVDLVLHFDEGKPYRVGRVDVVGNRQTRDAVARRAQWLNPGDKYNDDRLDESKVQLLRSGLFKDNPVRPLRIDKEFPPERPDDVDLVVRVDEDSTAQFRFEVSYSSAVGIGGRIEFSERNFDLLGVLRGETWRGAGQNLSAAIEATSETTFASLSWSTPFVMDGPYSFSVNGSYSTSTIREWDETRLATTETLGRNFLRNRLNVGVSYGYTNIEVDNVQFDAPSDAEPGTYWFNTTGFYATWDQLRPNRVSPTSGYLLSVDQKFAGLVLPASTPFSELNVKAEGYLPVWRFDDGGVTFFHLGAKWREIQALDEGDSVPFYTRIRGGGPYPRLRGYDLNKLGPKYLNDNGVLAYWGGNKDFISTLEFSVPVQGTNEGVRVLTFADYGFVWAEGAEPSVDDLRLAIGFGIRFPITLPVALDFAFLMNPEEGEPTSQVHFGLGQVRF